MYELFTKTLLSLNAAVAMKRLFVSNFGPLRWHFALHMFLTIDTSILPSDQRQIPS